MPTDERLKLMPFPDPAAGGKSEQPLRLELEVPPRIYMSEDTSAIKIGVWDAANHCWSTDPIGEQLQFIKESRLIKFVSSKFAPMAILQSRCTDYPYENWWLRCIDDNTALLDLWTKRVKLIFEIKPLTLKLIENKIPEL